MSLNKNRVIIFVHYDRDNLVDDYVYFYLKELQKNASHLIFISTAKLSENEIKHLSRYCSEVIVRENIGYDFMSYKTGLESFNYQDYDEVVICNDSVYGPLYPLKNLFEAMENDECDFWGITDNTDISYHLQSYFLVFKKSVIQSDTFKSFWEQVKVLHNKNNIIEKYEVGLTTHLQKNGFKSAVYAKYQLTNMQEMYIILKKITPTKIAAKISSIISSKYQIARIGKVNVTHYSWKELLLHTKMPFVKIELLRDNPMKMDINDFEEVIQQVSNYDTQLIKKHLSRMRADTCTK